MKQYPFLFFWLLLISSQQMFAQEKSVKTVVQEFLENMGGEELWKTTNFLYLKEKMWNKQANVIDMEVWLDLTTPKSKIKLKNETFDRVRAFTADRGWGKLENGRQYEFDSLRLKREIANWKRNIYSICRRIALTRDELTFDLKPNNILAVYEDTSVLLCEIELNVNSIPIKWNMKSSYGEEISIHGPLATFGSYSLPKWSTSQDGHWQFEYVEVKGFQTAPNISFDPENY